MPDQLDLWCKVAFNAVKNQHWDLVVSTAGPYGVHCPAYRLKKSGIATHWIADWRDLWVDNHIYRGLPGFRFVERLMEKRWSQEADAITTVSKPLAEILRRKYGNKVHVIYNGFDPEDFENLPMERVFPTDDTFRIVYTGTIYTGKRDPAPLFKAVGSLLQNKLNPEGLRIIFCGSNSDVSDIARKYSVNNIVEYAGFLPREVALRMQRDADALLFLEYESENVQGILTGKLFEYLFAGPPIIGVGVSDNSSVGQLLKRTGRGICLGINSDIIAEELIRRISEKHASSQKKIMNFKSISEYSRKEQSEKMLRILT
jgi:glycosyltransferase involved in cell wall biosynthesis